MRHLKILWAMLTLSLVAGCAEPPDPTPISASPDTVAAEIAARFNGNEERCTMVLQETSRDYFLAQDRAVEWLRSLPAIIHICEPISPEPKATDVLSLVGATLTQRNYNEVRSEMVRTAPENWLKLFERDPALVRRFQRAG